MENLKAPKFVFWSQRGLSEDPAQTEGVLRILVSSAERGYRMVTTTFPLL
jgi:hypothetical protein